MSTLSFTADNTGWHSLEMAISSRVSNAAHTMYEFAASEVFRPASEFFHQYVSGHHVEAAHKVDHTYEKDVDRRTDLARVLRKHLARLGFFAERPKHVRGRGRAPEIDTSETDMPATARAMAPYPELNHGD